MIRTYGRGLTFFFISTVIAGCASSSLKPLRLGNELPTEFSLDMREKFEIKEVTDLTSGPVLASKELQIASVSKPVASVVKTGKKGREKKKKLKEVQEATSEGVAVRSSGLQIASAEAPAVKKPPMTYPSRRPVKDPIWLGERLTFSIAYLGVSAGQLNLEVLPYKKMNDRTVYHIQGKATSSSVFSMFYRLNDSLETFLDYDGLFSHRFHLILDESKQSRDALELYDSEKGETFYWNRWNHKVNGYTETKEYASIPPFSQDSLSALYYLRTIPLPIGAVITIPIVSEGKSWEAVCTVVRREIRNTPFGKIPTLVIKPEMKYQGILKKSGDSYLWLTDDDRRIPVRLEAKVRIGAVVANLDQARLGKQPVSEGSPGFPQITP